MLYLKHSKLAQHIKAISLGITLTSSAVLIPLNSVKADDTVIYALSIPSQSLEDAVNALAAQTGSTISYSAQVLNNLSNTPVRGDFFVEQALEQLIQGQPLVVVRQAEGSYSIVAASMSSNADAEPESLALHVNDKIVIHGQKFESTVQESPESIVLVTDEEISQKGLDNLEDVFQQTPGVSASVRTFRIRGIDSGDVGIARSELASVYVDSVGLSGFAKLNGPRQLWDVEQVEVFRGPQSTNLGRNALAGAVVITTKDPEFENSGKLQLGLSEFDGQSVRGTVNANLIDGVSALRLTFEDSQSDGQVFNATRNEEDYNFDDRRNLRLKWLWQANDDLRVLFSYQDVRNNNGNASQFLGTGNSIENRISLANEDAFFDFEGQFASLTIDYDINDEWRLKSITSGLTSDRNRRNDPDASALDPGFVTQVSEDENIAQELRFNFDGAGVRSSSGIYLAREKSRNQFGNLLNVDLEESINNFQAGLGTTLIGLGVYDPRFLVLSGSFNDTETDTAALFSEWEVDFKEDWRFDVGARVNYESQKNAFAVSGSTQSALPTTPTGLGAAIDGAVATINPILSALANNQPLQNTRTSSTEFIPHIGATYFWNDDVSTSFTVSQGYRSGGTEITPTGEVNEFGEESLLNYEFALRSVILDGDGTFNANLYYGDWTDQQVDVQFFAGTNAFTRVENAGSSTIYGLETQFTYQASPQLHLYATAAYNRTKFDEFISGGNDLSGNEFARAPELTAALGFNYDFNNGFALNTNATYQSESFADAANTNPLNSHTLYNVKGSYRYRNVLAEFYVDNLFDKTYLENNLRSSTGDRFVVLGDGREAGARITFEF